jgi:hypothetical protein
VSALKRLARPVLAFLLLAQACTPERTDAPRGEFLLCSDDPRMPHIISIDFAAMFGRSSDYGRPISRCADEKAPCLDFPLLVSAPPRLPSQPSEEVSWRNGDFRFGLRILSGSPSGDAYVLEVIRFEARAGRNVPIGRWLHHFTRDEGLLTSRTMTEPTAWVRCGGRLTFDDLRALTQRLPREATPWPPE